MKHFKISVLILLLLFAAACILTGCGDTSISSEISSAPSAATLTDEQRNYAVACLKAGDTKSLVGYTLGDGVDVEGLVYRGGQNGAYYSDPDSLYPDVILSVGRDEPHILFCLYGEEAWGDFFGLKPGVDTLVDLRAIWGEPDVFEEFEGYSAIYFLNDKGYRLYVKLSDDTENAVVQSLIYKID